MIRRRIPLVAAIVLLLAAYAAADQAKKPHQAAKPPQVQPLARIVWLEPVPGVKQEAGTLPLYRRIDAADPRLKDYERWIDTEAARFARRLVYRAASRFRAGQALPDPVLPVVVRKDGNNAAYGLAIQTAKGVEEHPGLAYVILDPSPAFLGDTLLHESGHVVHSIAAGGRRGGGRWSAFPHTTFAVSDPLTALAEGYAIHMETLWGHYGNDTVKQAYYHRYSPSFEPGKGRKAEYFSPVDDLLNFAQVWARYQAVRDGMPAFEGHIYPGAYARTQMDPSRDRARLKSANAMLASEGVVASVLFWTSSALAGEKGARPAGGLDQPGLVEAEMVLLEALSSLPAPDSDTFRPDALDLLEAIGRVNDHAGELALARFVDVTKGVTARPAIRTRWRSLYENAIMLNITDAKAQILEMDSERGDITKRARQDPASLRAGAGPVIPVAVKGAGFEMKAFGSEKLPVAFDLNAISAPELAQLQAAGSAALAIVERERERAPFSSIADFAARTGLSLEQLGLVETGRRR